jgi:CRISPR-associated protein Csx10
MPDSMQNWTLTMELQSDLCPGSGDGFAGYVETDICFDNHGLPYIPGKRVKGCLRECGLDILQVDESYLPIFNKLFGETGKMFPGTLTIGNGCLEVAASLDAELEDIHPTELAEIYTSIRTRTKMDPSGIPSPGSLRTMRVINRKRINQKQTFYFPLTSDESSADFLKKCVKSLRSIGLNRSRGLGEVKCDLIPVEYMSNTSKTFSVHKKGDVSYFSYSLYLEEPVISAKRNGRSYESEDYIFGSAILGAFAAAYLRQTGLTQTELYEKKGESFRRIFLEGGVTFTAAMPWHKGNVYLPAPLTLKTDKPGESFYDESNGLAKEVDGAEPFCKKAGGFIREEDGMIHRYQSKKTSFLHHARPSDKAVGRATDKDGQMFSYEALSSGQAFVGSIFGEDEDIRELAALAAEKTTLRIGRSRTAQYGRVSLSPADDIYAGNALTLHRGDLFRMVAITPIILEDSKGVNTTDLQLIPPLLGEDMEIIRFSCNETTAAGYNGKWLLPRRGQRALGEGSTIVMRYWGDGITLDKGFIGLRNGEGYGQIRIEPLPQDKILSLLTEAGEESPCIGSSLLTEIKDEVSGDALSLLTEVNRLRLGKQAVSLGIAYGESLGHPPQNSLLQGISTALTQAGQSDKRNYQDNFSAFVKNLLDIAQPELKTAALAFATGQNKSYFKTDQEHLKENKIKDLMTGIDRLKEINNGSPYDFPTYQNYLTAAIQRVKTIRRKKSSGNTEKGGDTNADKTS